ncbi:MAG: exopolysaccharide biosynthesis polyprenyl glycosylphosphotransferase [Neisseriaceae bacterium]|nr:exopolysaccharide biosynthesis polyprenyl glycosylphosphotransferase [Neisseriaceae bacterium]
MNALKFRNLFYYVIGFFLTLFIVFLYEYAKGYSINPYKLNNSIIMVSLAYIFSVIAIEKLNHFPGHHGVLHIPAVVFIVYGLCFGATALSFTSVSISFTLIHAIVSVLFLFFTSYAHSKRTIQLAYIPVGNAKHAAEIPNAKWIQLQQPEETLPAVRAIVTDLHSPDLTDEWQKFLAYATLHHMPVYNIRQVEESLTGRSKIYHMYENNLGSLLPSGLYVMSKRILDTIIILVTLPISLPLMMGTAIAVRLDSKGPVLFTQKRVGQGGKEFTIYKFRSMRLDSEESGAQFAQQQDSRVTKVGRFIRKVRLDELPQLFNVLKGDMSLIGPRPEQKVFVEQFEKQVPFYNYRHIVKPGISGWAQVMQGYAANTEETQVKVEHDFYYIKYFSFTLDCIIVLKTLKIILTGYGAR